MRLVIREDGTNSLEDLGLPKGVDETIVVAQGGGERPTDFANRVIRRIFAFEQNHQSIARTVLLLSPRFDAQATEARLTISRMLMAHSAAALSPSDLILSAGDELDEALQAKVLALADVLTRDPSARALPVAVQFASDGVLSPAVFPAHETEPRVSPA